MIAHRSVKLQTEASKKSASDLAMASDLYHDPNEWYDNIDGDGKVLPKDIGYEPDGGWKRQLIRLDIMNVLNETLLHGMSLADDLRKRNERTPGEGYGYAHGHTVNPRQKVYVVEVCQEHGKAQYFFMGTAASVLKRLAKLEDKR